MGSYSKYSKPIILISAILLFLAGSQDARAQQEPQYTQYMFNTISVNPAYAGTRNALSALFLSRIQWAGVDGAPRTYDFTMHAPFNDYKMGIGFSLVADSYGPENNFYLNLNYAYRVNITDRTILSMGIKGGIYNYQINLTNLDFGDSNVNYSENQEQKFLPNAGMGLYLYSDRYYVGLSVPRLIQTNLEGNQDNISTLGDLQRHYFFMAGWVFDFGSNVKFKPSMISRMVEGAPLSTDLTAQFLFNNTIWAGASYKLNQNIALLSSIQVSPQLMIGYSYDFPVSDLRPFNSGSHEIIISYDFEGFMKEKLISPRFF
jgi:type IX secretion system PorP/SprF family membrane protein